MTRDYAWAQRQLFLGRRVRRQYWPTCNFPPGTGFDPEDPYWAVWHVWRKGLRIFQGWGGSGCSYYHYPDLGSDGGVYVPRRDDITATDWELYEDRLRDPEPASRQPEDGLIEGHIRPTIGDLPFCSTPEHFYPWPAYAIAAFIIVLMVWAILYLPWR